MPKKVLLVDDSSTTLMMEEMILKQSTPYECVTAKDGLDAISRAVVENPDLVLMDAPGRVAAEYTNHSGDHTRRGRIRRSRLPERLQ